MDYYNNYYEELYHAGLFSALRGRIRDGHKWITRTGTPGHYVYTYAKKIGQSAGRLFGRRKTTSSSASQGQGSNRRSDDGDRGPYGNQQRRRSESQSMSQREYAERQKIEDRLADKYGKARGPVSTGAVIKAGSRQPRRVEYNTNLEGTRRNDDGSITYSRKDLNTGRTEWHTTAPNSRYAKKSIADRIKEWGSNTLSSIRKTANDAAGAVSKGYESAKNWVGSKLASASGKGTSAATGARIGVSRTPRTLTENILTENILTENRLTENTLTEKRDRNNRTSRSTRQNAVADKQQKSESKPLKGGLQSMPTTKRYRGTTTSTGSKYDDGYMKNARKLSGKTYLTDTDQGEWHRNLQAFSKSASQNKNGKASIQKGLVSGRPTITSTTAVNGYTKEPKGSSKTVVSKGQLGQYKSPGGRSLSEQHDPYAGMSDSVLQRYYPEEYERRKKRGN